MIKKASIRDLDSVVALAELLWGDHEAGELAEEFSGLLASPGCAVFLWLEKNKPAGFAQCQLRHDYVESTSTSPVGYLEGIFVKEASRHQGAATALLAACEAWAREQGCSEFASDCELGNEDSRLFHLAAGFAEANRIICFTKTL